MTDLPIVAMTANAMPADRERCLAAGMNDFVAKPIDPGTLWAVLLKWIAPRQAPAQAVQTAPVEVAPVRGVAVPVDPARLAAACRELARALARSELRAVHLLETHSGLLRTASPRDFQRIDDALDELDFDRALEILRTFAGKVGLAPLETAPP
jgi:CheY-like chemotaxis protein